MCLAHCPKCVRLRLTKLGLNLGREGEKERSLPARNSITKAVINQVTAALVSVCVLTVHVPPSERETGNLG